MLIIQHLQSITPLILTIKQPANLTLLDGVVCFFFLRGINCVRFQRGLLLTTWQSFMGIKGNIQNNLNTVVFYLTSQRGQRQKSSNRWRGNKTDRLVNLCTFADGSLHLLFIHYLLTCLLNSNKLRKWLFALQLPDLLCGEPWIGKA